MNKITRKQFKRKNSILICFTAEDLVKEFSDILTKEEIKKVIKIIKKVIEVNKNEEN